MHNRRGSRPGLVWKVIFWGSLIGALLCLAVTVGYYWSRYWTAREYEKLRGEVAMTEEAAGTPEGEDPTLTDAEREALLADPTLEEVQQAAFTGQMEGPAPKIPEEVLTDAQESPIDFEKLSAINPDLYAWIRIPDTQIDYPIAQRMGEDNQEYYLHHDLYGTPQFAGCIFSQEPNAKDFSDPVTVLYGHNMKNGSMFQNLYKFTQEEFFDREHNYVYVYTPDGTLIYEVYACYYSDDRNILENLDFSEPEDLEKYVEGSRQPRDMGALTKEDVPVTVKDNILTLSTCVYGYPGSRLLVQAVLLYKDK